MAIVQSEGIIIRSKKYSETSLILDIYTSNYGLKSLIVSGVRKSKSKSKAGIYQVMNIVDLVFYDNQKDTLSRIKEARVKTPYTSISRDVIKSSIGMLMIEIFRNAVKEKETNYELYQFLREWLMHLDARKEALGNLAIQFSIELSSYLGFQPVNNYDDEHLIFDTMEAQFITDDATNKYCISPELSELVHRFLKSDRSDIHMIQITRATRSELLDKLIQYYQLHLESFRDLKSINILRQVLG